MAICTHIAPPGQASELVLWNGREFQGGIGTFDKAAYRCAAFDEDGPGPGTPSLFVAGMFERVDGIDSPLLARWDGTSWTPVGDFIDQLGWEWIASSISDIVPIGPGVAGFGGPCLLVGVYQYWGKTSNSLAFSWDGATWTRLAPPATDIHRIVVADLDGPGPAPPHVYASSGWAYDIESHTQVQRYDGGWTTIYSTSCFYGEEDCGGVGPMAAYDPDASGPLPSAIYAGGDFDGSRGLTRWDGVAWKVFDEEFLGGYISDMRSLDLDGAGPAPPSLYITGTFTSTTSTNAKGIVRFDGSKFYALGPGIAGPGGSPLGGALAAYQDGAGGPGTSSLYVGGSIALGGSSPAKSLVRWNGQAWGPLGNGLNNETHAVAEFDDGAGPRLYAGGQFVIAGGVPVSSVAAWDGQTWSALGAGCNHHVDALCVFDDGKGAALYAGGKFTKAGGQVANYIAKWDGAAWSPLGAGLNAPVRALAVHAENGKTALYAAGEFTKAGGQPAAHIAKWNGSAWSALGTGLNGNANALASTDGGLYVGGPFVIAGDLWAPHVARWSGGAWSAVSGGTNGDIHALAAFSDAGGHSLYAAGSFTTAGGKQIKGVARWKPAGWSPLEQGIDGTARSLTVVDPDGLGGQPPQLYVGGQLAGKGSGAGAKNLLAWNGQKWSRTLVADAPVLALGSFDAGPRSDPPVLAAGGQFLDIDGVQSLRIALLDCPSACAADCDGSGALDIDDFICFQSLYGLGDAAADCDQSGKLDIDDFICFQTAFGVGCP